MKASRKVLFAIVCYFLWLNHNVKQFSKVKYSKGYLKLKMAERFALSTPASDALSRDSWVGFLEETHA